MLVAKASGLIAFFVRAILLHSERNSVAPKHHSKELQLQLPQHVSISVQSEEVICEQTHYAPASRYPTLRLSEADTLSTQTTK